MQQYSHFNDFAFDIVSNRIPLEVVNNVCMNLDQLGHPTEMKVEVKLHEDMNCNAFFYEALCEIHVRCR